MWFRRFMAASAIVLWVVLAEARVALANEPPTPQEQWVVVTAPGLRAVVEPLCAYRAQEGMQVTRIDAAEVGDRRGNRTGLAQTLRSRIHQACRVWKGPSYVLLVGAATAEGVQEAGQYVLPALPGTVERMVGEPTDNGYGCLDEKLLPTIAVGRFPARTVDEARAMVEKTLAWERDRRPGEWKRQVTVLAGAPSYNPVVNPLVEMLAMVHLSHLPPAWSGRAIYWNPTSPFSLPTSCLREQTIQYLQRQQGLILYLGHSGAEGFWYAPRPGLPPGTEVEEPCFTREDWARVTIDRGAGVLATFGCYGCQLGGENGEGYGVYAMRNRHGPVAVIGSHGACWAAMALLCSEGLLDHLPAQRQSPRLGQVWLDMKKHLAKGSLNPIVYRALDSVDGSPNTPQATQRLEHEEMFVLLGDPAIRFSSMPLDVPMEVKHRVTPGSRLTVTARVPPRLARAAGHLTLERLMTSPPVGFEPLPPETEPEKRARVLAANHERANRFVLAQIPVQVHGPTFTGELVVPIELPWSALIVRLYLATGDSEGMEVQVVQVEKPSSSQASN